MPRAHRYFTQGRIFHITHRCHDRSFLLKFAKDRSLYREMLRELLDRFGIPLLGYCLTSNHVHLLMVSPERDPVASLMQCMAGDFAQKYNIRKKRSGAFWGDRYHATLVEGDRYLWRCLKYIDLNMVRAGVVRHPEEWEWCGYRELMGKRQRYRLIDPEALQYALGDGATLEAFRTDYAHSVEEAIRAGELQREAMWTESLAIGARSFAEEIKTTLKNRKRVETLEAEAGSGVWMVREEQPVYA